MKNEADHLAWLQAMAKDSIKPEIARHCPDPHLRERLFNDDGEALLSDPDYMLIYFTFW